MSSFTFESAQVTFHSRRPESCFRVASSIANTTSGSHFANKLATRSKSLKGNSRFHSGVRSISGVSFENFARGKVLLGILYFLSGDSSLDAVSTNSGSRILGRNSTRRAEAREKLVGGVLEVGPEKNLEVRRPKGRS